jgi:hypothetical protein
MSRATLGRLRKLATKLRQAIEDADRGDERCGLINFPRECCDHAVRLLALYLSSLGFEGLNKAHGIWRGGNRERHHVWLEHEGTIIDITADQFGESLGRVIVTRRSPWHDAWEPELEPIDEQQLQIWRTKTTEIFPVYLDILASVEEARPEL